MRLLIEEYAYYLRGLGFYPMTRIGLYAISRL